MQVSKLSVTMCAAALCWSVAGVQAADETPAQTAAIAALRQKEKEADSAASQAAAAAPAVQPDVSPAQAAAIAALRQKAQASDYAGGATNVLVDASGVVSPRDVVADAAQAQAVAEAQDAARQRAAAVAAEALRQEQIAIINAKVAAELKAEEAAKAQAAADQAAAQAKAAADAAAKKAAEEQAAAQKQAADRAAAQKLADDQAAEAKLAAADYPGKALGFQPIQAPPSPISPEKQALLDALLVKYQTDQVSPEEYHKQRAAILAQP